ARRARRAAQTAARGARPGLLPRAHRRGGGPGDGRLARRGAPALRARQGPPGGEAAMTDDDLRTAMHRAHAGDRPPALAAGLARPARRPLWLLAAPLAVAAVVLYVILRPAPPARLDIAFAAPTDFLLDLPGTDLLRGTPRFDLPKGAVLP